MKLLIAFAAATAVTGCAFPQDRITFVTTSNIGIGTDVETATATFGYDRQELIVAPVDPDTGQMEPLYANIQKNDSLLNPKIKQTFATGTAAKIVSTPVGNNDTTKIQTLKDESAARLTEATNANTAETAISDTSAKRTRRKRVLVFGTSSHIGLKLSVASTGVPEIQLGYKRKERASIPVQDSAGDKQLPAPSLFGSLSLNVDSSKLSTEKADAGVSLHQVIATGKAAENAASQNEVRERVSESLEKAASDCTDDTVFNKETKKCDPKPEPQEPVKTEPTDTTESDG